jgi:hypothetical protein
VTRILAGVRDARALAAEVQAGGPASNRGGMASWSRARVRDRSKLAVAMSRLREDRRADHATCSWHEPRARRGAHSGIWPRPRSGGIFHFSRNAAKDPNLGSTAGHRRVEHLHPMSGLCQPGGPQQHHPRPVGTCGRRSARATPHKARARLPSRKSVWAKGNGKSANPVSDTRLHMTDSHTIP